MAKTPIPNLKWYTDISKEKGMLPRCPFASVHRCPRFYQSLSLLGKHGSTSLETAEDGALLEKWSKSDLWPATLEQATGVMGPGSRAKHFVNFCPEVPFERFGIFASHLNDYSDELDRDNAHRSLSRTGEGPENWRWTWAHLTAMHYSDCPLYSPLALEGAATKSSATKGDKGTDEVFSFKPNFHGIGIDVKALWRRLGKWLHSRRSDASPTSG